MSRRPDLHTAWRLARALHERGDHAESAAMQRRAMELAPADPRPHGNLLFDLHYTAGASAETIAAEHFAWAEQHADAMPHLPAVPAGQSHARLRVGNEEYLLADLFQLPPNFDHQFDWVFEHTCFCAIDPELRKPYVDTIVRLIRPGGRLLAIFFLNPDHDEEGPPYRVSTAELDGLFGPYFTLKDEWVPKRTHPGREERELMRVLQRNASKPVHNGLSFETELSHDR